LESRRVSQDAGGHPAVKLGADVPPDGVGNEPPHWAFPLNRRLGPFMFWVTVAFLAAAHDLVVTVVAGDAILLSTPSLWLCIAIQSACWIEFGVYWWAVPTRVWPYFWSAAFPPLRMTRRDLETGRVMWYPRAGWQPADAQLTEFVSGGMTKGLVIALGVLLAAAGGELCTGGSLTGFSKSTVFQYVMLVIWVGAVVECMVLFVTFGWAVFHKHRLTLLIVFTPLFSAVVLLLVRRVVLGILSFRSIQRAVWWTPQRRIASLERKIVDRLVDVELLQDRIEKERRQIDGARRIQRGVPPTVSSSVTRDEAN
jgi:hypothetical protein